MKFLIKKKKRGGQLGHQPSNTKSNNGSFKKDRKPWNFGLTIEDKRVKKYSQKRIGNKHTEKTKEKCREARLKQKINKISIAEKIVNFWFTNSNINFIPQWRYKYGIADFYLPQIKLVIECNGIYWHSKPESIKRDKRKKEWLENNGYKVLTLQSETIKELGGIPQCLKF